MVSKETSPSPTALQTPSEQMRSPSQSSVVAHCASVVVDAHSWHTPSLHPYHPAGQSLAVVKGLGLDEVLEDRINLNGGAIALGHPLGCSGARISTTLLHLLKAKDKNLGVATMCIGFGQGVATVFEKSS